jgi:hypothetical protein
MTGSAGPSLDRVTPGTLRAVRRCRSLSTQIRAPPRHAGLPKPWQWRRPSHYRSDSPRGDAAARLSNRRRDEQDHPAAQREQDRKTSRAEAVIIIQTSGPAVG